MLCERRERRYRTSRRRRLQPRFRRAERRLVTVY